MNSVAAPVAQSPVSRTDRVPQVMAATALDDPSSVVAPFSFCSRRAESRGLFLHCIAAPCLIHSSFRIATQQSQVHCHCDKVIADVVV